MSSKIKSRYFSYSYANTMYLRKAILLAYVTASLIKIGHTDWKNGLKDKIKKLKDKANERYGKLIDKGAKPWEFEVEDRLSYPRGDANKLHELSTMWSEYYECCVNMSDTLTPDGRLPPISTMAYVGAAVFLKCNLCLSPEDKRIVEWWYSPTLKELKLEPMAEKETIVEMDSNLTIYHVEPEDAGVYQCQVGDSHGSLLVLEVVGTEEAYTIVKPKSSKGPYEAPPKPIGSDLTLISQWSPWSECSQCDRVGRRRRYGPCYIIFGYIIPTDEKSINQTNHYNETETTENEDYYLDISDSTMEIFQAFPGGLPCRSQYLPDYVRTHDAVRNRETEIMIGLCKEACVASKIFEVRDSQGRVVETANNSAGVFSLVQRAPQQPPSPARDIVFATRLQHINITCPGTTLRDKPLTWKIGNMDVVPRDLYHSSAGRMYVSARDHLVIESVKYTDTNLYSCWQGGDLAGSVTLEVWEGARMHWTQHLTLVAIALTVAVTLRVSTHVLHNKKRKIALL